jgi:hypothetical protein
MTSFDTQASTAAGSCQAEDMVRPVSWERRARVRFPVSLPFFYRTVDRRVARCGVGRILNISSAGVLAASRDQFNVDTTVELTIEWPVRLDGWIPIHLVLIGSIVRCELSRFAVAAEQVRLRPVGRPPVSRQIPLVSSEEPNQEHKMAMAASAAAGSGLHIVGDGQTTGDEDSL